MAVDRRRAYAGVLGLEGRSQHHERGCDRHAGGAVCHAWRAEVRSLGQWSGVRGPRDPAMAAQVDVETLYIEPGSPWENGYAESFHSRLRDEFLALEVFESLSAAKG